MFFATLVFARLGTDLESNTIFAQSAEIEERYGNQAIGTTPGVKDAWNYVSQSSTEWLAEHPNFDN